MITVLVHSVRYFFCPLLNAFVVRLRWVNEIRLILMSDSAIVAVPPKSDGRAAAHGGRRESRRSSLLPL